MVDARPRGIDISKYQDNPLNWLNVRKRYAFAFIRASYGMTTDPMFLQHRLAAGDSGIFYGAYHFLWSSIPGKAQAQYFVELAGQRYANRMLLPYAVDVEQYIKPEIIRDFVEEVFRLTKTKPIIYTSEYKWEAIGHHMDWAAAYPLWIAQYDVGEVAPTAIPDSWKTWDFWQYGSINDIGYDKPIDGDIFNGSYNDLVQKYVFKLKWPTDYGEITQAFGSRPEYYQQFGLPGHEGIDIKAPFGSNVYACAPGIVYEVRDASDGNAYGNHVRIDHENGYKTIYAHFSRSLVKLGDRVEAGQIIGLADSTGNSSGSHLHLSLKRAEATAKKWTNYPNDIIDPTPYLELPGSVVVPIYLKSIATLGLRVRKGPATLYDILYTLTPGEQVEALDEPQIVDCLVGKTEHWLKVKTRTGITGWSVAEYLKKV